MHQRGEKEPLRVGDHVPLAPLDPLGGVKSAWAATFRGLDAFAVDDAGGGNGVASHRRPGAPHQREIDLPPEALVTPSIKIILNRGVRRKILR
jgi:hypothetical protein